MSDPVAFRAGALCISAEPHRAPGEDWPCEKCIKEATRQLSQGGTA